MRGKLYNRTVSKRKALRKRRIAREVYYDGDTHPYYNNLHQYSKNKIHCSCPVCSEKTRNKGRRRYKAGNYDRHINYDIRDLKRQIAMDEDEFESVGATGSGSKRKNNW
jgi:hypothetical protein